MCLWTAVPTALEPNHISDKLIFHRLQKKSVNSKSLLSTWSQPFVRSFPQSLLQEIVFLCVNLDCIKVNGALSLHFPNKFSEPKSVFALFFYPLGWCSESICRWQMQTSRTRDAINSKHRKIEEKKDSKLSKGLQRISEKCWWLNQVMNINLIVDKTVFGFCFVIVAVVQCSWFFLPGFLHFQNQILNSTVS